MRKNYQINQIGVNAVIGVILLLGCESNPTNKQGDGKLADQRLLGNWESIINPIDTLAFINSSSNTITNGNILF